jgi:hypothetical protein
MGDVSHEAYRPLIEDGRCWFPKDYLEGTAIIPRKASPRAGLFALLNQAKEAGCFRCVTSRQLNCAVRYSTPLFIKCPVSGTLRLTSFLKGPPP